MDIRNLKVSEISSVYKLEDVTKKLSIIKGLVLGACSMHPTSTSSSDTWSMILTVEQSNLSILKKECEAELGPYGCKIYEIKIRDVSFFTQDNLVKRTPSLEPPLVHESEMVLNEQVQKNENKDMPVQFKDEINSEVVEKCREAVYDLSGFERAANFSDLVNFLKQKKLCEITRETKVVATFESHCFYTKISISIIPSCIYGESKASRKQDSITAANKSLIERIYAAAGRDIPNWIRRMEN